MGVPQYRWSENCRQTGVESTNERLGLGADEEDAGTGIIAVVLSFSFIFPRVW